MQFCGKSSLSPKEKHASEVNQAIGTCNGCSGPSVVVFLWGHLAAPRAPGRLLAPSQSNNLLGLYKSRVQGALCLCPGWLDRRHCCAEACSGVPPPVVVAPPPAAPGLFDPDLQLGHRRLSDGPARGGPFPVPSLQAPIGSLPFTGSASRRAIPLGSWMSRQSRLGWRHRIAPTSTDHLHPPHVPARAGSPRSLWSAGRSGRTGTAARSSAAPGAGEGAGRCLPGRARAPGGFEAAGSIGVAGGVLPR